MWGTEVLKGDFTVVAIYFFTEGYKLAALKTFQTNCDIFLLFHRVLISVIVCSPVTQRVVAARENKVSLLWRVISMKGNIG